MPPPVGLLPETLDGGRGLGVLPGQQEGTGLGQPPGRFREEAGRDEALLRGGELLVGPQLPAGVQTEGGEEDGSR